MRAVPKTFNTLRRWRVVQHIRLDRDGHTIWGKRVLIQKSSTRPARGIPADRREDAEDCPRKLPILRWTSRRAGRFEMTHSAGGNGQSKKSDLG
jgi:hypothetical protein